MEPIVGRVSTDLLETFQARPAATPVKTVTKAGAGAQSTSKAAGRKRRQG
jgi:hypothetical protein